MINSQPNLIWIVIDSLRADHLGLKVNGTSLTPNLDRFSNKSIVFQQAVAQGPSTPPSVKSFIGSTYPTEYDGPSSQLTISRPAVQTYLRSAGYTTLGITSNSYLSSARGWSRDFDEYDDCDRQKVYLSLPVFRAFHKLSRSLGRPLELPISLPAEILYPRAVRSLKRVNEPFFLWMQLMDVHWPYRIQRFTLDPFWQKNQHKERTVIRPRLISQSPGFTPTEHSNLIELYQEAVRYSDDQFGQFLTTITDLGLLENTIILVFADHGEEFGEHGRYFHSAHLYDELVRVPLLVYLPAILQPQPRVYTNQVRLIDIVPTLLDLANADMPDHLRGSSLLPILRGKTEKDRTAIIESFSQEHFAVRQKGWKLLFNIESGDRELYNLETDPFETCSLDKDLPEVVAEMQAILDAHLKGRKITKVDSGDSTEEDPEVIVRLRDLGYVE